MTQGAVLSELDLEPLLVDYNDTAVSYPDTTIVQLFDAQVGRTPDDEAVRHGGQRISYRDLDVRARRLAAHLRSIGIGRGRCVAVLMERSIEAVCAIVGILKSGAAYVPIDTNGPDLRLHAILKDIGGGEPGAMPVVITHARLAERCRAAQAHVIVADEAWQPGDAAAAAAAIDIAPTDLAYVIYTSGSTGTPKGVMIEHRSLVNYICWANDRYCRGERLVWPLFSSLGFDLTVTSIFTPLISGGRIVVYGEEVARGGAILKVVEDGDADIVKLTPAHLAMIQDVNLGKTRIRRLVVGGEDLKTDLARAVTERSDQPIEIYNEYGPTEATVGCMIHRYDTRGDTGSSVPLGRPAANAQIYILDEHLKPVAPGAVGEMFIGGRGLARGYMNRPELTARAFVTADDPRGKGPSVRLYRTGDVARWDDTGRMEFLGRADRQIKVRGFRVELGEIEAVALQHPAIRECVATVSADRRAPVTHCSRCGLPSTFPGATFDAHQVCNVCRAYDGYVAKARSYFKTRQDFEQLVADMKAARTGDYDCVVLYSGGKDSTYMLCQLRELGLTPLAFFLDNGFISDEAKGNIRRVAGALGVDIVFGTAPHMNAIFVDSIQRFSNVCNGCFKTIYTLATTLARERGIKYIVTGLSRGQFFETRLTEEVFRRSDFDVDKLDALVLDARKAYHQREDAVSCHLPVDVLRGDGVLEEIQFVDFYRYWDVPLEELYAYLETKTSWRRPSDTGRSTNCLINDAGIYLHKKQRGFHNYALPYSWDVRLGQKTRTEAMSELDDEIDEARVKKILAQIGYVEPPADTSLDAIALYYAADREITPEELHRYLAQHLPDYMVPSFCLQLDALPVNDNGKIDRRSLPAPGTRQLDVRVIVEPRTDIEKRLAAIWCDLLKVDRVGISDEFFDLGGHSLLAIAAVSRIRDAFDVDISLATMFEEPTIAALATAIAERAPQPGETSLA